MRIAIMGTSGGGGVYAKGLGCQTLLTYPTRLRRLTYRLFVLSALVMFVTAERSEGNPLACSPASPGMS